MYPSSSLQIDEDLKVRFIREEDAEAVYEVIDRNREYLREWLPWVDEVKSVEHERANLHYMQQQKSDHQAYTYAIFFRNELIGTITYFDFQPSICSVEIGYWLAAGFQGHGIMTRACAALIKQAFTDMEMNKIVIRCGVGNTKSCAIPRRLGFTHEGVSRESQLLYDTLIDLNIFSLLAREWKHD